VKYYKDTVGKVYPASDEDIAQGYLVWLPIECVEISEDEANLLLNPLPTMEQKIATAGLEKASRMTQANYQISLLSDLTDADIVDDIDPVNVALLKLWKKYRVALLAIVTTVIPVTWPVAPSFVSGTSNTAGLTA